MNAGGFSAPVGADAFESGGGGGVGEVAASGSLNVGAFGSAESADLPAAAAGQRWQLLSSWNILPSGGERQSSGTDDGAFLRAIIFDAGGTLRVRATNATGNAGVCLWALLGVTVA